jgi:hypothetical protein
MPSRIFRRRFLPVPVIVALCVIASAAARLGAGDQRTPIQRAIDFLIAHQLPQPVDSMIDGVRVVDFAGDWPQYFHLKGGEAFRVRDVSPFTVAFIHHALSHVVEENRRTLGVSGRDLGTARLMRQRAVAFLKRFESAPNAPDAGTFGFWPYDTDPNTPDAFVTAFLTWWLQGPLLGGQRVPINLSIYPSTLAIPSDADVTATTYASLLDDAVFDEGPGSDVRFERFFVDWRDAGVVPRRLNPSWLPPASGAFLTWLTYRTPPFPLFPNDVDLVVNANVLYALGRYDRLDVPGVAEAVSFINFVVTSDLYHQRFEEISEYYPDNLAFQYVVSRAFHEGNVTTLAPAVRILADDLEASALVRADGTMYWDKGAPRLNTAFAILVLLNAGRDTPIIERAIDYLVAEQNGLGGFGEATFFFGRADAGQVFEFTSESLTTAMALEALVRHQMAHCGRMEHRPEFGDAPTCR